MKNSSVLMIGGPKHGSLLAVNSNHHSTLNYYVPRPLLLMPEGADVYEDYATANVVHAPIEKYAIGHHMRMIARAPGISRETADHYFYDVVVDAYDRAARVL